jgi:amino acid adenylation domain-containing protein
MPFSEPVASPLVPELVARRASAAPSTVAVQGATRRLTYAELDTRATGLGAAFADLSGSGGIVAICLPRSPDGIIAMLAAWRAGMAYFPLDPAWPVARLAELIAAVGCAAVVAEPDLGTAIAGGLPVVDPRAAGTGARPAPPASDPGSLAYIICTSGSTGTPKAVEITHANLAALVHWHISAFSLESGCRTSHLAGLGFDASVWEIWPTLAAGGTLVLPHEEARREPAALRDWLVAERIEIGFAPTALAEPLVRLQWPDGTALRTLLTGADRLTVRPAPGLPFAFVNNYGPTESTVVATSGAVAPDGDGLPSIGRPIEGTKVLLLDGDRRYVAAGQAGEIWIGGAQLARGYRGDPALTEQRFVDHPVHGRLYRTGDVGRWLENGEIAFEGRIDAQLKVRGHRVEPAEVAAVLNRLPEVGTGIVVGRDGELVAYVVAAPGAELTASALRGALAERLPDYMIPARFAALAALPLTPNGKVDIAALPNPTTCPLAEAAASRGPENPAERRLFQIVAEVIGRSDFGVEDDFFLLGGHSLLGTQVVVRAREAFGVEITLFHLFEGRTVERLAAIVERLVIEKLEAMSDEEVRRMAAG